MLKELEEVTRDVISDYPDSVYIKPDRTECNYKTGSNGTSEGDGCLFGVVLRRMNMADLCEVNEDIENVLRRLEEVEDEDLSWFMQLQEYQDEGNSWSECLKMVEEKEDG